MITESLVARLRSGLISSSVIIVLAVTAGAAFNLARPGGIPFIGDWSAEAVTKTHAKGLEIISLDEAFELFLAEKALFIDAREAGDYAGSHIPGSVNITSDEAANHASKVRSMIQTGRAVIAYCSDADCPMAADLVKELKRLGVHPVKVMPDGWAGWMKRGYPYE